MDRILNEQFLLCSRAKSCKNQTLRSPITFQPASVNAWTMPEALLEGVSEVTLVGKAAVLRDLPKRELALPQTLHCSSQTTTHAVFRWAAAKVSSKSLRQVNRMQT